MARPLNALMAGEQTGGDSGVECARRCACKAFLDRLADDRGAGVDQRLDRLCRSDGAAHCAAAGRCGTPPIAAGVRVAWQRVSGVGQRRRPDADRPRRPAHRRRHRGHRRPVLHRPDAPPLSSRRSKCGSSVARPIWRSTTHQCARHVPSWCAVKLCNRSKTTFPCLARPGTALAKDPSSVRICHQENS